MIVAPLPGGIRGHFGPELRRFVLMQHHQGQVTVERLVTLLQAVGVSAPSAPRPGRAALPTAPPNRRAIGSAGWWMLPCAEQIVLARVGGSPKTQSTPGFCPGYHFLLENLPERLYGDSARNRDEALATEKPKVRSRVRVIFASARAIADVMTLWLMLIRARVRGRCAMESGS